MKRFALLLVCLFFMTACSPANAIVRTPKSEQTPIPHIRIEDTHFAGSILKKLYRETYSIDDRHEDERLQKMIASVSVSYPIDTLEKITTYSWALYDIAVASDLMSADMLPSGAERYADGILQFTFSPPHSLQGYYDGDEVSFLVSDVDGHIITVRTETMFLDPSASSRWEQYNGSDDLSPGERPALKSIDWMEIDYNERRFADDQHSADEWYNDQQWQEIAAGIDARLPLIEPDQITDWTWEFYDAATSAQMLSHDMHPAHAIHYRDGIWYIIFRSEDGESHTLLISDADRHIIHSQSDQ